MSVVHWVQPDVDVSGNPVFTFTLDEKKAWSVKATLVFQDTQKKLVLHTTDSKMSIPKHEGTIHLYFETSPEKKQGLSISFSLFSLSLPYFEPVCFFFVL
jgi:hypothetical protein